MEAADYFRMIRDIPYRIPFSNEEADHCCNGKTILLKAILEQGGLQARPRFCAFKWSDLENLPESVRTVPHENETGHIYLEQKMGRLWYVVDATWDYQLRGVLPVNEWTQERKSMQIAVPPGKIYSPKASLELFLEEDESPEEDSDTPFYAAFNEWLGRVRKKRISSR